MSNTDTALTVNMEEIYALQTAFNGMGKDAKIEAVRVTNSVASYMKNELKAAGQATGDKLSMRVAKEGLKTGRRQVFKGRDGIIRASQFSGGYIPIVIIGLDKPLKVTRKITDGNPAPTSLEVWAGTEFGSNRPGKNGGRRFTRPRKDTGYWFYKTWREIKGTAEEQWQNRLTAIIRKFENGG